MIHLIIAALALSGLVHLGIAPDHFSHAPAHGLFFSVVGLAQVGWAALTWRTRRLVLDRRWWLSGIGLSAGVLVVWLLTHFIQTPYADDVHGIDLATIITKAAEALALLCLLVQTPASTTQRPLGILFGIFAGVGLWGLGLLTQPYLGLLWHSHEGAHDHASHDHGAPQAMSINSTAYFSIVNASREADALIGVSGTDLGLLSLHRTTIDADSMTRMDSLAGVLLKPHTRADFAPAGDHIMLEGLPRDLYEGDTVTLNLELASGRVVAVEFAVLEDAPQGRVNFTHSDGLQISNAWVRATRTLDGLVSVSAGGYDWQLPPGFPLPRVPQNNPMTEEKVELGRHLFYDPRLSGNQTMSCSSCHLQEYAFTDAKVLPIGSTGEMLARNSSSLTNVAYNATLTWANSNLLALEQQILIPLFGEHPVEMGITGREDEVLERFRADEQYRALFTAAFPDQADPFNFNHIVQALASFNRALISGNSAYDRYLRGEREALSESAQRGMELFFSERLECHHCHTGFNLSLSTISANSSFEERPFFNTGLYNIDGLGAYPPDNTGLHEISNKASDMGRFRPPTLRNIALTAPYMHDGSIATLEEVLRFYSDGGRVTENGPHAGDGRANPYKSGLVAGFTLSDEELADLVNFLKSLSDEQFITDPRFSDPFGAAQLAGLTQ